MNSGELFDNEISRQPRHLQATGSRERAPDDRLREAIHLATRGGMDGFVAVAPRNDAESASPSALTCLLR
jgi:hypothetical protein